MTTAAMIVFVVVLFIAVESWPSPFDQRLRSRERAKGRSVKARRADYVVGDRK